MNSFDCLKQTKQNKYHKHTREESLPVCFFFHEPSCILPTIKISQNLKTKFWLNLLSSHNLSTERYLPRDGFFIAIVSVKIHFSINSFSYFLRQMKIQKLFFRVLYLLLRSFVSFQHPCWYFLKICCFQPYIDNIELQDLFLLQKCSHW